MDVMQTVTTERGTFTLAPGINFRDVFNVGDKVSILRSEVFGEESSKKYSDRVVKVPITCVTTHLITITVEGVARSLNLADFVTGRVKFVQVDEVKTKGL